jgi:hypothetical protein
MRLRTSTIQARHLARRCVQCGCERPTSALAHQCVECGCDLVERPPRSYAEMEGLVEAAVARPEDPFVVWRRTAMLERWLLTAFTGAVVVAFLVHALTSLLPA